MKTFKFIMLLLLSSLSINFIGCSFSSKKETDDVFILRRPKPGIDYIYGKPVNDSDIYRLFSDNSCYTHYLLAHKDLSNLTNLSYFKEQLLQSSFSTQTIWPNQLPDGFNPKEIIEYHKSPGFNLKKLHSEGITGKGVNIAFIDYTLLTDHIEFGDRVKYYNEVHNLRDSAHYHGCLVTSIASGKNVGVAPESDIYFVSSTNMDNMNDIFTQNETWTANTIDKILEKNKSLPKNDKIRVISISQVTNPRMKGYSEYMAAIERAKKENIFVINCNSGQVYGKDYFLGGVDIAAFKDKNNANNYSAFPWSQWVNALHQDESIKYELSEIFKENPKKILLAPFTKITAACATGKDQYFYNYAGGQSSAVPFIAGTYALACQVKPNITPEEFWKTALETGDPKDIPDCPVKAQGIMINPYKLIKTLQAKH